MVWGRVTAGCTLDSLQPRLWKGEWGVDLTATVTRDRVGLDGGPPRGSLGGRQALLRACAEAGKEDREGSRATKKH